MVLNINGVWNCRLHLGVALLQGLSGAGKDFPPKSFSAIFSLEGALNLVEWHSWQTKLGKN